MTSASPNGLSTRLLKESGRRTLTRSGLMQAWYRAQQDRAPEPNPESGEPHA